jgi:hypothetical protein
MLESECFRRHPNWPSPQAHITEIGAHAPQPRPAEPAAITEWSHQAGLQQGRIVLKNRPDNQV